MYIEIFDLRKAINNQKILTKIIETNSNDPEILEYARYEYDLLNEEVSDLYDSLLTRLGLDPLDDRDRLDEFIKL
jgi:hypothetical protein